ncbi:MAG: glycosyltransferase family 4 protein [Fibrobacter sp.]|nr:glycosyltransferase family 4 protein [Fibrobacter sp.]
MKPAKVCIIAKYLYPFDTRLSQQVNTLNACGIPCDVICGGNGFQDTVERIKNVTIYRVYKKPATKQSFLVYLFTTFRFLAGAFLKLLTLSLRNNYKVIVVHTLPEFLVFITAFNKLFGSFVVLDGRDLTVDLLYSRWKGKKIAIVKGVAVFLEKIIANFCDEIITASNGFKRSLVGRGVAEGKIKVLVNTADESVFRFDRNRTFKPITEQARLIYHGTVSERFGLLTAVKAMEKICKKIPGSTLHIFGYFDPVYRGRIEEYIDKADLYKNVQLFDPIGLDEVYKQVLTMDLGVVPYLSDDFMNLALSTKTFEYIASGLPVAASRLKSSEELFDDSCIEYAEAGNADDLADKVVNLCLTPELRESKRNRAYSVFYNKFTSAAQNEKYVNLLAPYLGIEDTVFVNASR